MSKVAVITDSTAYLPDEVIKEFGITVLPQILIWGEETFQDGIDIMPDEFYQRLSNSKVMPSTSQVSPATVKNAYEKLLKKGFDVISIFISSKLSGTVQSAVQAKEMLPEAKKRIAIIDSLSTAMAMGYQVLAVARAAKSGAGLDECEKLARKAIDHTGVLFIVDTLEFLHRGGRIGGASKLLGTALNLKPILELSDGRIESVDKVRTKSKANDRLIELLDNKINKRTPLRLATLHANAEEDARLLLETASSKLNPIETILASVSPVIGTHAGPGTVGLAYMAGM